MNINEHVESLRVRLKACPLTRDQIAAATDGALSSSWVSKFASGRMRNPRLESLLALERAIETCTERAA
jgi:transcriptional regulator with XRE-family HTH domain